MPFGISPVPEEFQRRLDVALVGLAGSKAVHGDILVSGCRKFHEEAVLDHRNNMTLSQNSRLVQTETNCRRHFKVLLE